METILIIFSSLLFTGALFAFLMSRKKREPLTFIEFFLKDKNPKYLHILGARRMMPEDGDSFDIFEHYVFDLSQLKFTKGGSQRGEKLDLKSEFVKRSVATLSQKLNDTLVFDMTSKAVDNEDDDDCNEVVLKVYHLKTTQSDTEVLEEMNPNRLVFVTHSDGGGPFKMLIYKNDQELGQHLMRGMSDYFFKSLYIRDKNWLCFSYRKEETFTSGMALCIINYSTGELVFDGFIQPSKEKD